MLKDVLDSLSENDRRLLMYAFEHGLTQYVVLPDNRFIGVNIGKIPYLHIETLRGCWALGTTKANRVGVK